MMVMDIKTKRITTKLRPHKLAILVLKNKDWRDHCLKVIEAYSQIWGGAFNLIIPTDGEKIDEKFWFLLENYDPDYIAVINDSRFISNDLKKELFSRLNTFLLSNAEDMIIIYLFQSLRNPHNLYPLTRVTDILTSANLDVGIVQKHNINYGGSKLIKKNLELLYYSVLGKNNENHISKLRAINFEENTVNYFELNRDFGGKIYNKDSVFYKYSPYSYSMVHLDKLFFTSDLTLIKKSPIVLIIGDKFDDYALYYDLFRLRYDVVWIPSEKILFLDEFLTEEQEVIRDSFQIKFLMGIVDCLEGLLEENLLITSSSLSKIELEIFKGKLIRMARRIDPFHADMFFNAEISKDIKKLLPYSLMIYEYDNELNSYLEQFLDSKAIHPIETPIPLNFNHRTFINHHWITDVTIENYKLPQLYFLHDIISAPHYSNEEIRISKDGFSYFCPNNVILGDRKIEHYLIKPEINMIDPFEIFRRIFESLGYNIEYSDDGLFEMESTNKFRSLDRIAEILSNESCIPLFERFIEEENPTNPDEGIMLKDSRIYISLDEMRNLLNGMDNIDDFIGELVDKKIVHRGFIFKCKRCLNTDWYHLNEITDKYTCKRCGKTQYYNVNNLIRQTEGFEPQWFYKLDEVFYLGYKKNMEVPILTLRKLKTESEESFLYINQIKLKKIDEPDNTCMEIDICCISDGEIIIGECKKPNTLTIRNINRYKNLAHEIGATSIFSTLNTDGFSRNVLKNIEESFGENKFKVFNGQELLN